MRELPHYLLFSETAYSDEGHTSPSARRRGRWRFILESLDGADRLEATDQELIGSRERLELLSVLRGLEALDQPSRVTLVTPSRYVSHGLRFGLDEWRESDWQWERYGVMEPVRNDDLWRRVDQALKFHAVECRTWRFDAPRASTDGEGADRPHFLRRRTSKPGRRGRANRSRSTVSASSRG